MTDNTITHPSNHAAEMGTETSSDADELADELANIGLQTVDDDKIKATVEDVDIVSEDTVRLWYRFPTGELIPETFEKPVPWDPAKSKLVRIVEYAGLPAGSFSQLKKQDIDVLLEETTVKQSEIDIEELLNASPDTYHSADSDSNADATVEEQDVLYLNESSIGPQTEYETWQAADPKGLVDDNRFSDTDETDNSEGTGFQVGAATGVLLTLLVGALAAFANWAFSALGANTAWSVLMMLGAVFVCFIGAALAS